MKYIEKFNESKSNSLTKSYLDNIFGELIDDGARVEINEPEYTDWDRDPKLKEFNKEGIWNKTFYYKINIPLLGNGYYHTITNKSHKGDKFDSIVDGFEKMKTNVDKSIYKLKEIDVCFRRILDEFNDLDYKFIQVPERITITFVILT